MLIAFSVMSFKRTMMSAVLRDSFKLRLAHTELGGELTLWKVSFASPVKTKNQCSPNM